jgi:hypothetical protein
MLIKQQKKSAENLNQMAFNKSQNIIKGKEND